MEKQPILIALCAPTLAPRRTRRTLLPLISALMMRYVGQGQEVGSSTSQSNFESMRMGGLASTLQVNYILP